MRVRDALFGWKMEKGRKMARTTGPFGRTWFRMVVYYWLNLNLNRSGKNSFENKIRIWNLCSVFLVHLSTPKSGTYTPLNRLLQRHVLFFSFSSLLLLWTPRRGLRTNARLWGIVGHNARWRIRNYSPRKKRDVSCQLGWKNSRGWKKKTKKCIVISVRWQVRKTLSQQLAVTIIWSRPWKGTKIRKITSRVSVTSSSEKAFKWQLQLW